MSSTASAETRGDRGRAVLRFLGTVFVFALVGPVVGGLVTIAGLTVFGLEIWNPGDALWVILAMIVYGLWASYPLGLVPALSVGALVALKDIHGGTSIRLAALFGFVAGAFWSLLAGGDQREVTFLVPMLIAAAVVATLVCWRLTRRRAQAAGATS